MQYFIVILGISLLLHSCGQNAIKQKELELREREIALKEKEIKLKEKDTVIAAKITLTDTNKRTIPNQIKKSSPNAKVMTMIFKGYEEGDNMYLIFNDTETGKEYSFQEIDEKKFNGIKIFVEDKTSEFEVKANPKYINRKFIVEAINKTVLINGPEGETLKTKAWVITDLKLAE
ncbi:MAG: hypothetical protein SFU87_18220 [Chitinophagaceae bacterium]|nr:hypothetical protein [Chitinophagaceae bacterium]